MKDTLSGGGYERAKTAAAEDAHVEAAVMREVLLLYPASLTLEELIRHKTVASTEFSEIDQIRQAVRDLIAAGLLHRVGDLVLPTHPAVYFHELVEIP
jgi:hypothetical protein